MKVKYIIVNKKEYDNSFLAKDYLQGDGDWVISKLKKTPDLNFIAKFDNDFVFAFKN
jgi:hypothetical protein